MLTVVLDLSTEQLQTALLAATLNLQQLDHHMACNRLIISKTVYCCNNGRRISMQHLHSLLNNCQKQATPMQDTAAYTYYTNKFNMAAIV